MLRLRVVLPPPPFHQIPVDPFARGAFAREHLDTLRDTLASADPRTDEILIRAALPLAAEIGPNIDPGIHLHAARIAAGIVAPRGSAFADEVASAVHRLFRAYDDVPAEAPRHLLATAAERADTYTHGQRVFFVVYAVEDAPELAGRLLRNTHTEQVDVAKRLQHALLRHVSPELAFTALYSGPLGVYASALWAEVPADRHAALLPALVEAALVGPVPVVSLVLDLSRRYQELRPFITWYAEHGEPPFGEPPSGRPDPERRAAIAAIVDGAPPDPWTKEERALAATAGADVVLPLLQRASTGPLSGPARRRATAALSRVVTPEGLMIAEREATCVSLALDGSLAAEGLARLLSAVSNGARLRMESRRRAAEVAAEHPDPPFGLLRLGLPGTHEAWAAWLQDKHDMDEVRTWDQSILLALPPEEATPLLRRFYADITPNQRRALIRTVELDRRPEQIPGLLDVAAALDASMADAVLARMAALVGGAPAIATHGIVPARACLGDPALRASARRFLDAAGAAGGIGDVSLVHTEGSVSLSTQGGVAIADDTERAMEPEADPEEAAPQPVAYRSGTVRADLDRLAPPPRRLPAPLLMSLVLATDSGLGVFWSLLVWMALLSFVRNPQDLDTVAWIGGPGAVLGVLHHVSAGTVGLVLALHRGVLALARPSAALVSEQRGRRTEHHWKHTLDYLGDDGKMHRITLTRTARQLRLEDDSQEPLLVVPGAGGRPTHAVAIDALRAVQILPDGRLALTQRGWIGLAAAVGPMVLMLWGALGP